MILYKLIIFYQTLSSDAHVESVRLTPRSVVHAIRQLYDNRLEHVIGGLLGVVVHVPCRLVLSRARIQTGADQRARTICIVMGRPLEQSPVVGDPVEVGALLAAIVHRRVAVL